MNFFFSFLLFFAPSFGRCTYLSAASSDSPRDPRSHISRHLPQYSVFSPPTPLFPIYRYLRPPRLPFFPSLASPFVRVSPIHVYHAGIPSSWRCCCCILVFFSRMIYKNYIQNKARIYVCVCVGVVCVCICVVFCTQRTAAFFSRFFLTCDPDFDLLLMKTLRFFFSIVGLLLYRVLLGRDYDEARNGGGEDENGSLPRSLGTCPCLPGCPLLASPPPALPPPPASWPSLGPYLAL